MFTIWFSATAATIHPPDLLGTSFMAHSVMLFSKNYFKFFFTFYFLISSAVLCTTLYTWSLYYLHFFFFWIWLPLLSEWSLNMHHILKIFIINFTQSFFIPMSCFRILFPYEQLFIFVICWRWTIFSTRKLTKNPRTKR